MLLAPAVTLHGQETNEASFDRGDFLVRIEGPRVITRSPDEIVLQGVANAGTGSLVKVTIGVRTEEASVDRLGRWEITWPEELAVGVYQIGVEVLEGDRVGRARKTLVLREGGRIPIKPLIAAPPEYGRVDELPGEGDITTYTDRWRITPPPYELTVEGSRWDPYNQNKLKGDFPIIGDDKFLVLTATSDTFIDAFSIPVPSSISPDRPDSNSFFGQPSVLASQQNFIFTADFYEGDTAFKPFNWRVRASAFGNLNYLQAEENQVVKPDVSRGTDRFTGLFTLQELFFEKKLADLSPNYDFVSVRVGIQPFNSDFRGFVFNDINLAVRFFGSTKSNRNQFNLYLSDRLEKDTNSQLNRFELREQQVAIVNFYRQDLFVEGYNGQWSIHYFKDEPSFFFDRNGVLARPDPIGEAVPHEIEGVYLGWTGFGHFGRLNIDHALYWALGEDSLNPIAGRDPVTLEEKSDISAFLAAIELSFDKDWYRPRFSYFYASGDDTVQDRDAEGFDAIFDAPNFAGGPLSYWNRLGIRLTGTLVALNSRGSLLPDLTTSRDEGQPNFVNPGIHIPTIGLDMELTPKWRAVLNLNYLFFDHTEVLEAVLFQKPIAKEIGFDLAVGTRYRPFLNNNFIVQGGIASLIPGRGWGDIFETRETQYAVFSNLIVTF